MTDNNVLQPNTRLSSSKFKNTERSLDFMKWYFDEDEEAMPPHLSNEFCDVCIKSTSKKCGRCYNTFYCSKDCQSLVYHTHKNECYPMDGELVKPENKLLLKSIDNGLFNEMYYLGVSLENCTNVNVVKLGKYMLYTIITNLIFQDPVNGSCDPSDTTIRNEIYKAGRTLSRGGIEELYSYELWKFIPRIFHGVILDVFKIL